MPASVPASDSGTVAAAAKVGISRRMNSSTTSSTSAIEISRVICTSRTLARIVVVRSVSIDSLISGGIQDISCGSRAFTRSTVSITLASGIFEILSKIAG